MTKGTKLKAAIVGCGSIGSLYDEGRQGLDPLSHAGAYSQHPRTQLVAGADNDPGRRAKFVRMWGVPVYEHYSEMFTREQPDIISICTWPDSHTEIGVEAAEAGARVVFCEKPLSISITEGAKLIEACEKRNIVLAVNHTRRWDRAHQEIKNFLARGELGRLQDATVHYSRGVSNYGSHIADLLRFFFGEVQWVRAFNRLNESYPDPALDAYLNMRNGMGCAIVGCRREYFDVFEWDVMGTSRRLRIEDFGRRIHLYNLVMQPEFPKRQAFIEAPSPFSPSLRGMMLAAVDNLVLCATQGQRPACTGRDGLAAVEIVTALKRSAASGGERVSLPLESDA